MNIQHERRVTENGGDKGKRASSSASSQETAAGTRQSIPRELIRGFPDSSIRLEEEPFLKRLDAGNVERVLVAAKVGYSQTPAWWNGIHGRFKIVC